MVSLRTWMLALVVAPFTVGVHAQDDVSGVGQPAGASAQMQHVYDQTRDDASWLESKQRAGEAYNRDDVLLQQALDAKRAGEMMVNDSLLDAAERDRRMAPYLDAARDLESRAVTPLAKAIDEMIGADPQVRSILEAAMSQQDGEQPQARYLVAASRSMGDAALKTLVELGQKHPDMVIVFRGLMPGEKIEDLIRFIAQLQPPKEGEPMASVAIDPTLFSENGIDVAPTLIQLNEEGAILASVRGVVNPEWIASKVEDGLVGDLGAAGPVTLVSEEDMIVAMQRQAAEIDLEAIGHRMLDDFWRNQTVVDLPKATQDRTREVDPTVVVTDGIYGPDGTVIAFPGQRINPFDAIPFTMHVIVLDGRDPEQVAWAREQVVSLEGKEVSVMTVGVDPDQGWDGYGALVEALGRHVYILPPEVVQRFQLERVPSTVEGGNRVLIVKEYAMTGVVKHASSQAAGGEKESVRDRDPTKAG